MKLLIVTNGFFPGKKYGGPPVSINNLCNLLKDYEFFIITKNHDLGDKNKYDNISEGWNKKNNKNILYLSDSKYNIKTFNNIIKEIKPDLIYLQSLFQSCIIPCLYLAKKHKIKVLLAPRGELCIGAFKKKYKKIPYLFFLKTTGLIKNISIQSTSNEETIMSLKYLKVKKRNIYSLNNIPSIPDNIINSNVKNKNSLKMIFISRVVPKKNLLYALECLSDIKGKVVFDIYGSIENKDYWNKCTKLINQLPSNITINYKGIIEHDKVLETFSKYDLFFFPTLSENFGHVIAESLLVGCPVLISNQTPFRNLERVDAGYDISLTRKEEFISKIQFFVDINNDEWHKFSSSATKYANNSLNIDCLKEQYKSVLSNIVNQ